MNRFIETLCILDGLPQHLTWHQQRVDLTFRLKMGYAKPFSIQTVLDQTTFSGTGKIKCTIEYAAEVIDVRFAVYEPGPVLTLKLVEIPDEYDYSFKYADRTLIDRLHAWRDEADDILMTRGGWVTDTSIANIGFRRGGKWFTPSLPLLAGTTWKRLVYSGQLLPKPIHLRELALYDCYKVFNAMNDFASAPESTIKNISSYGQKA